MSDIIELPHGPYSLIYADPPWSFKTWSPRGDGRSASQHYGCMSIKDICALPVKDITAKDAVLFLWVVQPLLPRALEVIKAWGFTFKTVGYVWVKIKGGQDRLFYAGADVKNGLGYHTRAGCEQCWIAVKGSGYDRMSKSEAQVVFSPLREHSRKPDEIRESIERLVGDVPKLEMFARESSAKGWDTWGNETEKFDDAARPSPHKLHPIGPLPD